MASRSTNTVPEALQGLLRTLTDIKVMAAQTSPDDLPFLIDLETTILGKLGQPFEPGDGQMNAGMPLPGSSAPPPASGMAPSPMQTIGGMIPMGGAMAGGPCASGPGGAPLISGDDLRRMMPQR